MLRSLQNLESEEYQAVRFLLAGAFHAILLATSGCPTTGISPEGLAASADHNAAAFLARQGVTHPDERS